MSKLNRKWVDELLALPDDSKVKQRFYQRFGTHQFFETTVLFTRNKPKDIENTADMSLLEFMKLYAK